MLIEQVPTYLSKCYGLADKPGIRRVCRLWPMPRHVRALPIHLKNQFRMTSGADFGIKILMARDACVRPNIQILQIAHACCHAISMRIVRSCVRANPVFRRAVAVFAGNTLGYFHIRPETLGHYSLKRRMTNSASRALRRIANFQNLSQSFRAGCFKRGVWPSMMKIVREPDRVLIVLLVRTAVATAGTAALGTQEFRSLRGSFI